MPKNIQAPPAKKIRNTKAQKELRTAQGYDITKYACLECLDTQNCNVCNGDGLIPTWDSETGQYKKYGGRVQCWKCKGGRKCIRCTESPREAA